MCARKGVAVPVNLVDLRYFKEVAQELNITNAAGKLYLSQQNLSQRIKQLEEYYQVALFERKPTLRLTVAGERLLEYIREIETAENSLMADLSCIRQEDRGRISFGVPTTRTPIIIPPLLSRFKQRYRDVEFSLREGPTASLEEGLINGEIDLAVGVFSENTHKTDACLDASVLLEEKIYLVVADRLLERYMPAEYPECKKRFRKGIFLKDFLQFPVILYPRQNRIHTEIEEYYRSHGAKPNVLVEAYSGMSLIPLCLEGLSCIFLPHMFKCHLFAQNPDMEAFLNYFPIRDCVCDSKVVLMRHRDRAMSKYMKDLIHMVEGIFLRFREP